MPALLSWFITFLVTYMIGRLAALVVIWGVGTALIDYFFDEIWALLGQFGPIAVLQLAGVGDAISIIASAALLKVLIDRWTIAPSSMITGGGS